LQVLHFTFESAPLINQDRPKWIIGKTHWRNIDRIKLDAVD
jgi:hypothetical protein